MADFSMCKNPTCPVRTQCKRHEASGTKPEPIQQYWMHEQRYGARGCGFFMEATPPHEAVA